MSNIRTLVCLAILSALAQIFSLGAAAQDHVTVSNCPAQPKIPVTFTADCSHVHDDGTKQLCTPFLENQACKVFPAYRKITGLQLEKQCPSIRYNIYEKDNWPYPNNKGEGGLAGKCEVTLMTDYSVKVRSKIGPYDLHELLHEYQFLVGPFPVEHPFFDTTQTEAAKEIGDPAGAEAYTAKVKDEVAQVEKFLAPTKVQSDKDCASADLYIENTLYLQDPRIVYAFYRKLGPVPASKERAELYARVNRMLYIASGEKAKPFLLEHGCGPF
jgi:hypothetical protein